MQAPFVEFLAEQEITQATAWYANEDTELADRFKNAIREALKLISERPSSFPKISKLSRRCLLTDFPYKLIFQEMDGRIAVTACSHTSRHPMYWRARER